MDPGERAVVTLRNGNLQIMVVKLLKGQVGEGGVCELGVLLKYLGNDLRLHKHR